MSQVSRIIAEIEAQARKQPDFSYELKVTLASGRTLRGGSYGVKYHAYLILEVDESQGKDDVGMHYLPLDHIESVVPIWHK